CSRDLPELPQFLEKLIADARNQLDLRRIILYGSRARCDHRPTSDYDLAFELDKDVGWSEFLATQSEDLATLLPVDFLLLNAADDGYKEEVQKTGKILYERGKS